MTQRLEYIDALRGFTMILVVLAHIINFGYHITDAKMEAMETFNNLFVRFRMPLFFFISGFVLYKHDRIWNNPTIKNFIKTKFLVQIVPTTVFFLLFCFLNGWNYVDHLGNMKAGYWFTIALFEFFVLYCFSALFTNGGGCPRTPFALSFCHHEVCKEPISIRSLFTNFRLTPNDNTKGKQKIVFRQSPPIILNSLSRTYYGFAV